MEIYNMNIAKKLTSLLIILALSVISCINIHMTVYAEENGKNSRTITFEPSIGDGFDEDDDYYEMTPDGLTYYGRYVISVSKNKLKKSITIQDGTIGIAKDAFAGTAIESIVMPDSLTTIEEGAFAGCTALKSITLSKSIEKIGAGAFEGCTSLTKMTIPAGINEIPSNMLAGCTSLTDVIIEEGITSIGSGAFKNSGLTSLTVPNSVGIIASSAVAGCSALADVYYGASKNEWNSIRLDPNGNDEFTRAKFHYTDTPIASFTDMPNVLDWRYAGLRYCVTEGLMTGTSASTISPDMITSRAQLVTLLWRIENSPAPEAKASFTDLTDNWYIDAVSWASENGIVKGTGDTTFSPNRDLTRQEVATFIFRYAAFKGTEGSARAELSDFPDHEKVADFAKEALSFAVADGIITGVTSNGSVLLDPMGVATRAQIATILMRYCSK